MVNFCMGVHIWNIRNSLCVHMYPCVSLTMCVFMSLPLALLFYAPDSLFMFMSLTLVFSVHLYISVLCGVS